MWHRAATCLTLSLILYRNPIHHGIKPVSLVMDHSPYHGTKSRRDWFRSGSRLRSWLIPIGVEPDSWTSVWFASLRLDSLCNLPRPTPSVPCPSLTTSSNLPCSFPMTRSQVCYHRGSPKSDWALVRTEDLIGPCSNLDLIPCRLQALKGYDTLRHIILLPLSQDNDDNTITVF